MVIKGLKEGRGRIINGKKFVLGQTFKPNQKRMALKDAKKLRSRGVLSRVVPVKIGFAVFSRRRRK